MNTHQRTRRRAQLGCVHRTRQEAVDALISEDTSAWYEFREPRTPCPCCGGGVAIGGVDPCIVCFARTRRRRRVVA